MYFRKYAGNIMETQLFLKIAKKSFITDIYILWDATPLPRGLAHSSPRTGTPG
jgi:hypothetical protein